MTTQTSILPVRVDNQLKADATAYETWFRAKVQEALGDTRDPVPQQQVLDEAQALIDRKRRARSDARP